MKKFVLSVATAGGQRTTFFLKPCMFAMAQGRPVCRQARRQPGCSNGLRGATKMAGLSACSDAPLANAIPPKLQYPRVGAHCQGLGPAIEVLAPQCKPEDVIVQLHAPEPLCGQHFTHCSLHLFLSVLADCFPGSRSAAHHSHIQPHLRAKARPLCPTVLREVRPGPTR